jgi:hypothetical protein
VREWKLPFLPGLNKPAVLVADRSVSEEIEEAAAAAEPATA